MTPEHKFTDKRRAAKPSAKADASEAAAAAVQEAYEPGVGAGDEADYESGEQDGAAIDEGYGDGGPTASGDESDRYLRLAADFDNYRRRTAQQMLDQSRYSSEAAARALLPVLDNLERALEHAPEDEDSRSFVDGVRMAVRDFVGILEELAVTPIESVGAPFDPSLHEAIGGEESPDVEVETVTSELQRGWLLHDRVLRPAIVKIATPAGPPTR